MTVQSKVHENTISETSQMKEAKSNSDKEKETLTYFSKAEWTREIPSLTPVQGTTAEEAASAGHTGLPAGLKTPIKFYCSLSSSTTSTSCMWTLLCKSRK